VERAVLHSAFVLSKEEIAITPKKERRVSMIE